MQELHFAIEIKAPREQVWNVLWDDTTYRDWTRVFAEGSYAVSDWKAGSSIQFLDPHNNAGMASVIEKLVPHACMAFKHVAEIRDGKEQPAPKWSGALETYTLQEHDGRTVLTVDMDAADEYKDMFEAKFPQALQRIKELAEQHV